LGQGVCICTSDCKRILPAAQGTSLIKAVIFAVGKVLLGKEPIMQSVGSSNSFCPFVFSVFKIVCCCKKCTSNENHLGEGYYVLCS
jgi:hypothetical protein